MAKGNVLAIMSPKGGVGKTVTSVNLAVALAKEFNKKILVVDTNVTTASLGFHFNLLYPNITIYDVLKKNFSIKDAIYPYSENLDVIPASIAIEQKDKDIYMMQKNVKRIIDHYDILLSSLISQYDLIILDSAGGFNMESIATMHVADGILLVTNPEYPAIAATAKAIEYAKLMEVPMGGVVLTKVKNKKYEFGKAEVEDVLKIKVLGEIPMDDNVSEAIALKKPVIVFKEHCRASIAYKQLAGNVLGQEYKLSFSDKLRAMIGI